GAAPHTPAFASPEQARGETATPQADVFGFGRLAREVLADQDDPALTEVLEQALAERAEERPASAGEVARALGAWGAPAASPSRGRGGWWLAAIAASVAGAAVWFVPREGSLEVGYLLEALREAPLEALPEEPELLIDLAEEGGDPNFLVAAARQLANRGDFVEALEYAALAREASLELGPPRRLELAFLFAELDLPAMALELLDSLSFDVGDDPREAELLYAEQRARQGFAPELELFEGVLEDWLDEHDYDELTARLVRLGLAHGAPLALEVWLEEEGWREADEYDAATTLALLELKRRLAPDVVTSPRHLDDLERAVEEQLEEGPSATAARAMIAIQLERFGTWGAASDPERLHFLESVVDSLDHRGEVPVLERVTVLAAALGQRRDVGDDEPDGWLLNEVFEVGLDAGGEDTPISARLEALVAGEADLREPLDPTLWIDVDELHALLEDAELGSDWWVPR
ncbi:MAG: hypothetical protein AAFZ65_00175, partial [Planctomycetota bacterium]